MIKAREMNDDAYIFDEENYRYVGRHKGKIYALGDKVMIKVKKADLLKKQLDYAFIDDADKQQMDQGGKGSKKKRRR